MKKSMVLILITVFLMTGTLGNYIYGLNNEVKVYIDGEALVFDTKPVIVDGRTMVPLRAVFEALSMDVSWDGALEKVRAEKEGLDITLFIGSKTPTVNGEVIEIDVASYIDNGRTMVPLRFIAESTGALVEWDANTGSVMITRKKNELSQSEITRNYKIVDTGVSTLYTDETVVGDLSEVESFYGQDAQYDSYQPSYSDNGDGTVTDHVTNLMWQQTMNEKMTYEDAILYANEKQLGGHSDWRISTIKELFSLIIFTGESGGEVAKKLYIDTKYFDQPIGDTSIGEREIDAQTWSSTQYVSTTMKGDATVFGVNFIDGRIKGYALIKPKTKADNKGYFRLVRGNEDYGKNDFVDNGDGTISDLATGLMWQLADDGETRDWEDALAYSKSLDLAGYSDWRLPNVKELQSIVDYTKSVKTTQSPAIDSQFNLSEMLDPNGDTNYGFYWTSTTHQDGNNIASSASYVAFGEAQGEMNGTLMDVHGAGSVRSDPKSGSEAKYPSYFGPQGDIRYVYNYVLSVRTIEAFEIELVTEEVSKEVAKDVADYNLFAPLKSTETYLMDMEENIAHTWSSLYNPGNAVYMNEDGSILRTGALRDSNEKYSVGGSGGIVERIEWDGDVTWSFEYADDAVLLHHDIETLPNDNVLMIAWETLSKDEAISNGRDPSLISDNEIWPDHVIEVNPNNNEIVWEWHLTDHLIQDYDASKSNYGVIGEHPELADLNYIGNKANGGGADWMHTNAIDYNEALDQILLSVHGFNEIWIIDHSTTTDEAASHEGGNQNAGGDILFRWGNPQAYGQGDQSDQTFFGQHDAQWILNEEHQEAILVFNNGVGRGHKNNLYSSVDQIIVERDGSGNYKTDGNGRFLPEQLDWAYKADQATDFFSQNISGAQRLENGHTLICNGSKGVFFEIDSSGEIVWEYKNEFSNMPQSANNNSPVFRVNRYVLDLDDFDQ